MEDSELAELRKLIASLQRSLQRHDRGEPIVDIPPVVAIPESRLIAIVEDIMEKRFGIFRDDCRRMIHEEAESIFDEDLPKRFAVIGLRIDTPEAEEKARRMFDKIRDDQKNREELKTETKFAIVKIVAGWVAAGIGGLAIVFGLKGGSH